MPDRLQAPMLLAPNATADGSLRHWSIADDGFIGLRPRSRSASLDTAISARLELRTMLNDDRRSRSSSEEHPALA